MKLTVTRGFKWFLIALGGALLFYFLFIPRPAYKFGRWGRIFNWEKHRYSFCTYAVPASYQFVSYENNDDYTNEAAFFENTGSNRYLILIKFEEFPAVDTRTITTTPSIPRRSVDAQYGQFHNIRRHYYRLWDFIPGFMSTDFERLGDKLLLRGLRVNDRHELTTPATQIVYFVGDFDRIGFYRQWKGWGGYPVPVLDFMQPRHGGIAVIRSKQSPETIFAILSTPDRARFDETEFRQILESVTFEKQTPSTKEWIQSFKRSGQYYQKETTQWGPFKWEREKINGGNQGKTQQSK